MAEDIRWQQRFSNYCKALDRLEDFLEPPALNEREQQGLIKAFEYTYELAWNTLRDLLGSQGDSSLLGSRDTLREAFRLGLIEQGEAWMLMLQDRNLTSHAYNRATADAIAAQIIDCYLPCFQQLRTRLEQRVQEEAPLTSRHRRKSGSWPCSQHSRRWSASGCLARGRWGVSSQALILISA